MHPTIKTGTVAIYARFSSDRQRETSIEDQVRRCRDHITQAGGDPETAQVFSDFAISGASLDRPGFEALMQAVDRQQIQIIITEDLSRISRDFADSANIFKRLQYAQIPLIGVADGIDTSSKNAKLSYTVKSLVADLYLDDLRDKTLRGLEGRALAGYATGNTPYGFRTVAEPDSLGNTRGHRIEIDEDQAAIVQCIFWRYKTGMSLARIARKLNEDGVPSPRAGSRHKCKGWGASTIRAMLYNEKYVGVWKFKETQWVKVPGTNRRTPRARDASEVMCFDRPELRIIDAELWDTVQKRLAAMKRKYTRRGTKERVIAGGKSSYLLSGILVCGRCDAPMVIHGGTHAKYYRCGANRTKGTCEVNTSVREEVVRTKLLATISSQLSSPDGIAYVQKRLAEELADFSRRIEGEIEERQDRLKRTEDKIRSLIEFIAQGERSDYIVTTLRDLEAHAKTDKTELDRLRRDARSPLSLPSLDHLTGQVFDLPSRFAQDPVAGRHRLKRWLQNEEIRLTPQPGGTWLAEGAIYPFVVMADWAEKGFPEKGKDHSEVGQVGDSLWSNLCSGDTLCATNNVILLDFESPRLAQAQR